MTAFRHSRAYVAAKRLAACVGYPVYFAEAEWLSRVRGEVFFVQIGAHDGLTGDHIHPVALSHGWRGLAVEPVPPLYRRLEMNYRGTGVRAVNAAVGESDGRLTFYSLRPDADPALPDWYDQIGSFRRDVVLSHADAIPDIAERIEPIEVECLTLSTLLARYRVERIDVLLIDTEGYDLVVLREVDFARYGPRLVIYERKHLGGRRRARGAQRAPRGRLHGASVRRQRGRDTTPGRAARSYRTLTLGSLSIALWTGTTGNAISRA